jgi:hypothetical protein
MKLEENKWRYSISKDKANNLLNTIENGDLEGVRKSILDIYEEIFNNSYIDIDDYSEYTEEVIDMDLDEDEIDYQLSQLYDLCDNLGIFISPTPELLDEAVDRKDSEFLGALEFLDENPTAYAYICSAEINGKEMPVGKGVMTSEEYQDYIKHLSTTVKLGKVNTMYQNDKEEHRKSLHDSLEENISKDMSVEEIAKKHNVPTDKIEAQLEKGIEVEKEHTSDEKKAERIALDHLFEIPDYYDKLDRIEKDALKEDKKKEDLKIDIEVLVSNYLDEKIVSGNAEDKYDDQTLEEWYDFASNIEGIIDRKFIVKNINLSKNIESLSEYIDFYCKDKDGNKKDGLVNLRLSDHKSTSNARRIRKNKASKIDPNYKLVSIIVNEHRFDSYDSALEYIKNLLDKLNESLNEDTVKTKSGKWVNKGKDGTHGEFKTKKEADAQRKAMFANGFKEELNEEDINDDDFPFPEAKPEKEISIDEIEELEYNIRDTLTELHNLAVKNKNSRKIYLKSLQKIHDELYDLDLDEELKKDSKEYLDDNFEFSFDDIDLDEDFDKIENLNFNKEKYGKFFDENGELIKGKEEEYFSSIDDEFDLDEDRIAESLNSFQPENSTLEINKNLIKSTKEDKIESNNLSDKVDPTMDYDDVEDIELR